MNVESKPAATQQAPQTQAAGAAHGKSKAASGGADAASDTGDFSSLLLSLGGEDGDDDAQGLDQEDAGASLAAAATGQAPGTANAAPTELAPWAVSLQALQGQSSAAALQTGAVVPGAAADAAVQGVAGARRELPAAQPGRAGARHGAAGGELAAQGGADGAGGEGSGAPGRVVAEQARAAVSARQHAAAQAANAADTGLAAQARDARDAALPGARAGNAHAAEPQAQTALTPAVAGGGTAEQALAAQTVAALHPEHRGEKRGDPLLRLGGEAAWNTAATARDGAALLAPAAGAAALDEAGRQVAEQVSYWLGRDVQNAEIKLDRFGHTPVEVSISLQGKEAHVAFRTDAPEMRQVLQSATAQLKDMLQSQGLSLAGVAVGGSGADTAGRQAPRGERAPARQALVAVPQVQASGPGARVGQAAGRALDVFV